MPSYSVSFPQLFFEVKNRGVYPDFTQHQTIYNNLLFCFCIVQLTAYTQDILPSSLNLSIKLAAYIDFYPMTVGTTDFIHIEISVLHSYI